MHDDMQNKLSCVAYAAHMLRKRNGFSAFLSMPKKKESDIDLQRIMENVVVRKIYSLVFNTSLACCCDNVDRATLTV
jgi:hypothetical protein